jgi:glutathione synthase/RimK-type ligase-like ATP-grasp enzyme
VLLARDGQGRRLNLDEAPAAGVQITLEGPANRAAGGGARDLRDGADPAFARVALEATEALGLRLAGVDMFDRGAEGLCVIEVNSNPMIATLEEHGRWDLIAAIWRVNFDAALR